MWVNGNIKMCLKALWQYQDGDWCDVGLIVTRAEKIGLLNSLNCEYWALMPATAACLGSMFSKVIVLWRKIMLRSPIVMCQCQFHYCGQLGDKKEAHYSQIAYILVLIGKGCIKFHPSQQFIPIKYLWLSNVGPLPVRVKTTSAWFWDRKDRDQIL